MCARLRADEEGESVEAIGRMRRSCEHACQLCRPHHYRLQAHTVVGRWAGVGARLRADKEEESVIVRARMVETT